MKKIAFGILCMAAAVLLMSHNTYAVDLSVNVNRVWSNFVTNDIQWVYGNSQTGNGVGWTASADQTVLHSFTIMTMPGRTCTAGDIYEIQFNVYNITNNNSIDAFVNGITPAVLTNGWEFIQTKVENFGGSSAILTFYVLHTTNGGSLCQQIAFSSTLGSNYMMTFNNQEGMRLNVINIYHPTSGTDMSTVNNAVGNINSGISDINLNLNNVADKIDDLQQQQQQQQQQEQQATDNISNQTPSNISQNGNTENQASTNLIGAFSSFVNALTNIQTGNCNITLAFPAYAGGSQTVNICQNKDKAGNLISVFSSLTLIVFYVPLAIRLLTMIYNEIRSFTNG